VEAHKTVEAMRSHVLSQFVHLWVPVRLFNHV
jgi:hypothetical protein